MARIVALDILKAAPQHADLLGSSGLAMLLAIVVQWDYLGGNRPVRWSNSMLSERSGVSRNCVDAVRSRLVEHGWITYQAKGRNVAGHYSPHLPGYHKTTSAVEYMHETDHCTDMSNEQCNYSAINSAMTVQSTVQLPSNGQGSYIPVPNPQPQPDPSLPIAPQPEAKSKKPRQTFGPEIPTNTGAVWQLPLTTAKRHMTAYRYSEAEALAQLGRLASYYTGLPESDRPGMGGMHQVVESWLAKHAPRCPANETGPRAGPVSADTLAYMIQLQAEFDAEQKAKQA